MHTQKEEPIMVPLPYFNSSGLPSRRVLVKPTIIPETTNEAGVLLPENAGRVCEQGVIVGVGIGSTLQIREEVTYKLIERGPSAESYLIDIDGVIYHQLFENEIWTHSEIPLNRVFVEVHSGLEIGDAGIVVPDEALGILQYGTVRVAPVDSIMKSGDEIGYRRNEQAIYPTVTLNGKKMEVLMEPEVYTINGNVSPYRIIVRIDKVAQNLKRRRKENGLLLHPNFIHMKRNLQYGIVHEIGEKAALMYAGVEKGDCIAIHHFIEHQGHRLIGTTKNKKGDITSEFRILECFDRNDQQVYAKFNIIKGTNSTSIASVIPYGNLFFLEWNYNILHSTPVQEAQIDDVQRFSFDISRQCDLEEMRAYIDTKKKAASERYASAYNGLVAQIERLNPEIKDQKDHRDVLETKIEYLKRSADYIGHQLNVNYLAVCKVVAPRSEYAYAVTSYKELYPIDLFNKRYLVAYSQFILGYLKTKSDMTHVGNFVPIADKVLIEPLSETTENAILIPEGIAAERPSKGRVVSCGPGTSSVEMVVSPGDVVTFRKRGATEIIFHEGAHLLMPQNDLLGVL